MWAGLVGKEPVGNIEDANTFVLAFGLAGAGNEEFRVGVADFEERGNFTSEGFFFGKVGRNLDVDFFILSFGDEVDFFIVESANIDFVTAAEKFDSDDVLVGVAIIEVFGAEFGVFDAVVAEVILVLSAEIGFALNIITFNFVKGKSIAKIT